MDNSMTQIDASGIRYRNIAMQDLFGSFGFARTVSLLVARKKPSDSEAEILDMLLVSAADHGEKAPSAHVAVSAASCRASLSASVSAGLITIGDFHGGAARRTADMLAAGLALKKPLKDAAKEIVLDFFKKGIKVPGLGHRHYKEKDPRAELLLTKARALGIAGDCCCLISEIRKQAEVIFCRPLPINIDGAQGAILSDLGWTPDQCEAVFIIARTAGLCARVLEEREKGKPLRFLSGIQGG